jgi:uncharacterized membrane protein YecN with MAPEG domain
MAAPAITTAYAVPLAIIYLVLAFRVIGRRRAARAALGDGGDADLARRIRAHANFAEYVPLVLVLMMLAELGGAPIWMAHTAGACLLAGRVAHAVTISRLDEDIRMRVVAMVLTFTALGTALAAAGFSLFI